MTDRIIVRLKIISTIHTPDEVTNLIGLRCDRSWYIGDKRPHTAIAETSHGWILNSQLPETAPLYNQIEALLHRLHPYKDSIQALSELDVVELSCVIYAAASPALNFTKDVIHNIAQLGASLDVDLYLTADD
jgi:hypothetical protein